MRVREVGVTLEVWWSSLAAADRDLLGMLDAVERGRLEELQQPADRGRSMVGAALLRVAVARHLGVGPGQVTVDRTCEECGRQHGAPRVVTDATAPWVSVSHSGLLVAVALSTHGRVGIDVQRAADLPGPVPVRDWVRREAAFKARAGHPAGGQEPAEQSAVTVDLRPPLPGYAAALTALGQPATPHVEHTWP